jgi:hypothetical protein
MLYYTNSASLYEDDMSPTHPDFAIFFRAKALPAYVFLTLFGPGSVHELSSPLRQAVHHGPREHVPLLQDKRQQKTVVTTMLLC